MLVFLLSFFMSLSASSEAVLNPDQVLNGSPPMASLLYPETSPSKDSSSLRYVQIDKVFVLGNKKTKERIILRELSVSPGQTLEYKALKEALETDRNKIFNTKLFNSVEIVTLDLSNEVIAIVIKVSERWYTFPVPIFDLVDRNFNDWWTNQNRDLSRVNYGFSITKENSRGRNERLKFTAQFGFLRKFQLGYSIPYIDKSQRHGLSLRVSYSENKNIAFSTVRHRQRFLSSEKILQKQREVGISYSFRKSFFETHAASISYSNNVINDTVTTINPEYFLSNRTHQRYLTLSYGYSKDKRDILAYPLSGFNYSVNITKFGLGVFNDLNKTDVNLAYTRYFDLGKGFYVANYSKAYLSAPERQAYNNFNGLGYGRDFVKGYELYLIEGQNYLLNKTSFKKRLLQGKKKIRFLPDQFNTIPYAIYLKTYFDFGYVDNFENYEVNSRLSDRYLFGTGLGLDVVTFYDLVYRFEYSINREGERGIFFHINKEF